MTVKCLPFLKFFLTTLLRMCKTLSGIKKNSIADVWIQAYLDVRKARKKSEELKNIEKLYGSGL